MRAEHPRGPRGSRARTEDHEYHGGGYPSAPFAPGVRDRDGVLAILALVNLLVAARGCRLAHGAGLGQALHAAWTCGDSAFMPDGRVNEPLEAGSGKFGSP